MEFISLVSKLTSSVPSISRVASFALKHAAKCADDIWDCYVDEIAHANLNSRVNLLYLLDALLDKEGPKAANRGAGASAVGLGSYRALVERDLGKVVAHVVPETREGILNWMSVQQVRQLSGLSCGKRLAYLCPYRSCARGKLGGYWMRRCSSMSQRSWRTARQRAWTLANS